MNLQKQIEEVTLSFFKTINAEIIENDGLYTIIIPKKYFNYFQKSKIQITFDEKISEDNNCELIIPGSKTLFLIITNCNNKGSISIKQSRTGGINPAIRYHFYVNFSGLKQFSKLFSATVDLQNMAIIDSPLLLDFIDLPYDFKLNSERITPSFDIALDNLKQKSNYVKSSFIDEAQIAFEDDFKLFITRYDDEIRELDDSISKKEASLDNFEKIKKFRFEVIDKIEKIEKVKTELIKSLQNKHMINLDYNLVAAEILLL